MIETLLIVVGGILFFEMLIAWLKALTDEKYSANEFKYCEDCDQGFCAETPRTKGCVKWERELKNVER